jgi:hypothetical protein
MTLIIAIGNFIGTNQGSVNPPYGGYDMISEDGIQMVGEAQSQDIVSEEAP